MTLPSQFARPTSRHNHMFRRRRIKRRLLLVMLAVLLIGVFGMWRWSGSGGDTTAALADARAFDDEAAPAQEEPSVNQPLAREAQPRETPRIALPLPEQPQEQPREQAREQREPEIRMGESLPQPPRVQVPEQTKPSETTNTQQQRPAPRDPAPQTQRAASEPARSTTQRTPAMDRARQRMQIGLDLLASNRPIEGRLVLTQALDSGELDAASRRRVRESLTELNERLVFSPEVIEGDPYTFSYAIRPGDALSRLPRAQNVRTDWRFIQRVNRIARPEAIRAGQRLKLVSGPFHAVVYKRQFRMDVYLGDGAERVYVRSFPVGLGEYDSTPVGTFKVRPNSKLINPEWVNPRTGERFLPDDPTNPIGEHWIGLVGVSEGVRDLSGYGIHGTIEPQSIGQQASMGCIRLLADDVELIYELLVEEHSTVEIVDR